MVFKISEILTFPKKSFENFCFAIAWALFPLSRISELYRVARETVKTTEHRQTHCSLDPAVLVTDTTTHDDHRPTRKRRKRRSTLVTKASTNAQQVKRLKPTILAEPRPQCDMDILAVACAIVAAALYYNTLNAGFVYDDRRAILTNPDLLASSPWYPLLLENDFWGTPLRERGSHGSYRPLCVATFRLNYLLGGLDPRGYHFVNVILHAACTGLVVRVAKKVLPGRSLAHAIAGLLFAVHPIHSEAVAGIVGRADLLACLLTLVAFLAYVGHCNERRPPLPLFLALLSSLLATLAKETGISSLALCLLWEFCHGEPTSRKERAKSWPRNRSIGIITSGLLLLLVGRLKIGGATTPEFASADNPTARHPSRLTRGLTFLYLPAASARMLLCPSILSFDWSMDAIPRITGFDDVRNLESVCLYCTLAIAGAWVVRRLRANRSTVYDKLFCAPRASSRCPVCTGRRNGGCHTDGCRAANNNNNNNNNGPGDCYCSKRASLAKEELSSRTKAATAVATSLGFLTIPFLPASNLFFYVGFVIAERILYLPSVGACLSVGAGIAGTYRIARRTSKSRGRVVLAITACLLGLMAAKTLRRNLDWYDEESLYRSALHVNPPKAYGNLGSVLSAQGRVAEAEEALVQALRYRPNMADVHYNLGILQQGRRNYEEAILSYQRAIHFRPSLAQAYVNLGSALVSVGRGTEAAGILRAGASLDGSALKDRRAHEAARVQALLQLGGLYADQGKLQGALSAYKEALHVLPEHYPPQSVYNLLGETLSRLQQYAEAERWFQASLASQPDHVPAHITYGKLLARNSSRVLEAERWFLRARRLAPNDPSVHHHYGMFLTAQGRLSEAAEEQLRAAELSKSDYELSVGAASALRQADRRDEAEIWYRHAVGLRPNEARSHTNLGAILHLNGKYRQAAEAYREALRLQPGDATTMTNLHKLAALLA
ncbi:protein O-mannosyl-transferase TMTC2 [Venturia canescens]|uniref:protein O-mannosyl-transferase TMTC2 n=1 Tax=Venturia canescens TaxID=32260 RepID=UPI001C9C2AA0|nr:protein O-mannosyl-transferase TMTC2 [Venturia canescens]